MNWYRLILHDMRNGLFRVQYFLVPLIVAVPCIIHWGICNQLNQAGGWMDYIMYCFRGMETVDWRSTIANFQLPILWLLVMSGCLFLNLEYPLRDLSTFGLQVMIRSNNRTAWFLSKCCWNVMSCCLYVLLTGFVCLLFAIISGGHVSIQNNPAITPSTFALATNISLSGSDAIWAAVICPAFNLCALNMLQMLLSFICKPIIGFISGLVVLVLSVYWTSPLAIGNGAMIIRSNYLVNSGVDPLLSIIASTVVIIVCVIIGSVYFRKKDILGSNE